MRKNPHNSDAGEFTKLAAKRLALNLTSAIKDAPPKLSLREAESLTGIPHGTIGGWLHSGDVERLRFILLKLALLPLRERSALIERFCPQFPTPNHDLFDPDPLFRDQLARLAEKRCGTTVITGGDLYWSSFVATALANGSAETGKLRVVGIDACVAYDLAAADIGYRCACLLPVPGVAYIPPASSESEFKRNVEAAWRQIVRNGNENAGGSHVRPVLRFLINGIWRFLVPQKKQIASLGRAAHVILGLETPGENITDGLAKPIHLIRIVNVATLKLDSGGELKLRISEVENQREREPGK